MYEVSLAGQRASLEGAMQNRDLLHARMNAYQNGQPIPANTGGYSNAPVTPSGGASTPPPGMPPLPPSLGTPTPAPSTGGGTPSTGGSSGGGSGGGSTGGGTTPAPMNYQQAFDNFRNFIGYDYAFDEAMRALSHQYAAGGGYLSGAAGKAFQDRAAQLATQMAAFPYLNYLSGQQAMGAQAGSALAGVGSNFGGSAQSGAQNYANSASNINAGMGGAIGNGANALSNAAIANGIANANMWSGVGSALGNLGSSLLQNSNSTPVYGDASWYGYMPSGGPIGM